MTLGLLNVNEMTMINSNSIDSFLTAVTNNTASTSTLDEREQKNIYGCINVVGGGNVVLKKEVRHMKHSPIEEVSCTGEFELKDENVNEKKKRCNQDDDIIPTVDLSKSLPNRNKKKVGII